MLRKLVNNGNIISYFVRVNDDLNHRLRFEKNQIESVKLSFS